MAVNMTESAPLLKSPIGSFCAKWSFDPNTLRMDSALLAIYRMSLS
jgi:hypothetical protein